MQVKVMFYSGDMHHHQTIKQLIINVTFYEKTI